MKKKGMKAAVIQAAVKKGIRDIRDDPRRGIRNVVKVAEMLAGDVFEPQLFQTAMDLLRDEDGPCFRIIEQLAGRTDIDTLATFGVNLGYNAIAKGGAVAARVAAEQGFGVPWCLMADLGGPNGLEPAFLAPVLAEGRALGCRFFTLRVGAGYPCWPQLALLPARLPDCAFALFVPAEAVDEPFCALVRQDKNIAVLLEMGGAPAEALQAAAAALGEAGALCGGYARCGSQPADTPALLEQAARLALPFVVQVDDTPRLTAPDEEYARLAALRTALPVPVFPLSLYGDVAYVGRALAGAACLATVLPSGQLELTGEGGGTSRHSLQGGLAAALRAGLPKSA